MPMLVLYACQKLFSQTKATLEMRNQWSCKGVYKELRSVNTSKAGCIAFLPVCTLKHTGSGTKELKENSMGLSLGCLSVPEFLLLREWKPRNCYSSAACLLQMGVWKAEEGCSGLCVSVLKLKPRGGEAGGCLMNRKTGLLHCSPHCWSFPSCFACPLTELFMASGLAPDLSHTCQQQQVLFANSPLSLFPYFHSST